MKRSKHLTSYIIIAVALLFSAYSLSVRFQNPELSETELFLKIIGF